MDPTDHSERKVAEEWFEPDDSRRFAVLLRRMVIVLGIGLAIVGLAVVVGLSRRIESGERSEDRALAMAVAAADPSVRAELAASSGREAMTIIDGTAVVIVSREIPDRQSARWLNAIGLRAQRVSPAQFSSTDPFGARWWHTVVQTPEGGLLLLHRRESDALRMVTALRVWMAVLGVFLAAGLAMVWWLLRNRVESSTKVLLDAAEDLRLRGEIRPEIRDRVISLPERPLEFKRLARALEFIERDGRRSFDRVDSLLEAARSLGSSLEPSQVLERSLEQLEHVLGVPRSAILRLDPVRESFTVLALRGHDDKYVDSVTEAGSSRNAPSVMALREGGPVQVSDTESDLVTDSLRERSRKHGYRSVLVVPLPTAGEPHTVLVLHKPEPFTYSHDDVELAASFASIAAAALRNAELFARIDADLASQTGRLEAIVESVDQGILVESVSGDVIYANSAMRALLPPDRSRVDSFTGSEFLHLVLQSAADPGDAYRLITSLSSGEARWSEVELQLGPSESCLFRITDFSVADSQGRPVGRGQVWTDVTVDHQLDRMKSGILATISHEFRTPLALIKGYATTLLADDVTWNETDREEFLALIASESDRLTELVQRLLDMRRIDAGMVELQFFPVEIETVLAGAIAGLPSASERVSIGGFPDTTLSADAQRLTTALRNLVSNALAYSPPDSVVEMSVSMVGDFVEFTVSDRGDGVPKSQRLRIFEPFVRADDSLAAPSSGVGLGLAITRGFVEAHGGRLWVDDRKDGVGSVFHVSIPIDGDAPFSRREPTSLRPTEVSR